MLPIESYSIDERSEIILTLNWKKYTLWTILTLAINASIFYSADRLTVITKLVYGI